MTGLPDAGTGSAASDSGERAVLPLILLAGALAAAWQGRRLGRRTSRSGDAPAAPHHNAA